MKNQIQKFMKYRWLLSLLIQRDLKTKYRRSFLGYIWSLLNPLLMMVVISSVFSYVFRSDIENFPIYLLAGQIIFTFFADSTNAAMMSIVTGGGLIKKVYVPKYILPLSKTLSSFVTLLFSLIAIVIVLLVTKTPIKPTILLFPLPLFYLLLISTGVGMILSALAVYFRDVMHLYGVGLTALMYFTPIFYPISILPPTARLLMKFNPLFHVIEMFRSIILYGTVPTLRSNLVCLSMGLLVLGIGLIFFKKKQGNFILYI